MHKNEKWIKLVGTVLCEIFTVCTILMLLAGGEPDRLALAFGTLLLVLLPMLLEKLFTVESVYRYISLLLPMPSAPCWVIAGSYTTPFPYGISFYTSVAV